jgi:hypothetical protein
MTAQEIAQRVQQAGHHDRQSVEGGPPPPTVRKGQPGRSSCAPTGTCWLRLISSEWKCGRRWV